jgi:hypothetical protein
MRNLIRSAAAAAILSVAASAGAASITLINPGAPDSVDFTATLTNGSGNAISRLVVDLSTTTATGPGGTGPLILGGLGGQTVPLGMSTAFFGFNATEFGFNYLNFNDGLAHTFNWDPDTADNSDYGARLDEFVGARVTATVGGSDWTGTVVYDVRNQWAIATLTEATTVIPVPGALLLMLSGLAGFGVLARRTPA